MGRLRRVLTAAAFIAGTYVSVVAVLYAGQDALIFPAPSTPRFDLDMQAARVGANVVYTTAGDGVRLYGWHHPADGTHAVLYFHGNGEVVGGRALLADAVVRRGWDFYAFAHRGYPGSDGEPSEAGMALDATAALRFITEEHGIPATSVVVHGWSLGGGNAVALAARQSVGGLVVESSFTSLLAVAQQRFFFLPTSLLLRHRFDSGQAAGAVDCPVVVVHGTEDSVVPVAHGRALSQRFDAAKYVEVDGAGHLDLVPRNAAAWDAYADLLTTVREASRASGL